MTDEQKQQLEEATRLGIEKGYLLSDETIELVLDGTYELAKERFNNTKGIAPTFFVLFYPPDNQLDNIKDQLAEDLDVDRYKLDYGSVHPSIVLTPDSATYSTYESRSKWLFNHGYNFELLPSTIIMLSEAWTVSVENSQDLDQYDKDYMDGKLLPSQHPRREESMIISCSTLDLRNSSRVHPIDRTPEDNIIIGPRNNRYDDFKFQSPLLKSFWDGYRKQIEERFGDLNV